MKKYELLEKMMIKPKKLTLREGAYHKQADSAIYTNVPDLDLSYLLHLAEIETPVQLTDFPETEDTCVLMIGEAELPEIAFISDNKEEYDLEIGETTVLIAGKTAEGMLLGLKTFIRLSNELEVLPQMVIQDYPDIPFRALHTCMFKPNDGTEKEETTPQDIKKMMQTAAICGYNYIFIEFWGVFPYSLEYAHWPNAYTKEEIRDLVDFAIDKLHITPLPAQNLTSHAGWSRIISRQHTVLDQRPDLADMYIPGGWCFATENPKTQAFLKQLMDELIDMFRNPPYLHCGCDKAFGFGSTEEDRTMSADVLFVKHISFLNSYLSAKNIRMVMWADMIYSSMDALYWKCGEQAADYIPKNVLINIWTHNNPGKKWQDAVFFEEKGFEAVYSPFINAESIDSMVEVCRSRKSHGIVQTTWHKPQTAVPYVILSGALQWCGKKPDEVQIAAFKDRWYR